MATVPARTVSWLKRLLLRWSVTFILIFIIPPAFAVACFGVCILIQCPLEATAIVAAVAILPGCADDDSDHFDSYDRPPIDKIDE